MESERSAQPFRVETQVERGVALLSLFGALDMHGVEVCEQRLRSVEARASRVVLDLRGLSWITSSGVGVIARAQRRSRLEGWELVVVRGRPSVDQQISLCPMARGLDVVASPTAIFPPVRQPLAP